MHVESNGKVDNIKVSVFALFKDKVSLDNVYTKLRDSGFRGTDISAFMSDQNNSKYFAHEMHTKIYRGISIGVISGAFAGGIVAWFGWGELQDSNSLISAGQLREALLAMSFGIIVMGVVGALFGLTQSEFVAIRYDKRKDKAGILIAVHCDSLTWIKKAKELLKNSGGSNIVSSAETVL